MRKDRLLKLAEFLETLSEEKFDIASLVREVENGCGTVCCAVGWMPAVDPENWEWKPADSCWHRSTDVLTPVLRGSSGYWMTAASIYFSIDRNAVDYLFFEYAYDDNPILPRDVAMRIRQFIEEAA